MLSNWPGTHSWEIEPGRELHHPKHVCLSLFPRALDRPLMTADLRGGSACWLSSEFRCPWDVASWALEGHLEP